MKRDGQGGVNQKKTNLAIFFASPLRSAHPPLIIPEFRLEPSSGGGRYDTVAHQPAGLMLEPNGGWLCCSLRRVSHVMIRIIGQLPGPHSLRKDLGTNRMSRRHRIRNGAARSVHPRGLDRSCHAVFLEPRLDLDFSPRVASLGGAPAGRVKRHRHQRL